MEKWTAVQRAFIVKAFFKNNDSYISAIRAFRKHFKLTGKSEVPSRPTVKLWVKNFEKTAHACKNKPTGRKRSVRTPETTDRVRHSVQTTPTTSIRKRALNLKIKPTSLQRILSEDLSFHPYKILIIQKLQKTDFVRRKSFAEDMLTRIDTENPMIIHEKPLHSAKLTVWMGVAKFGIVGPYVFDETVNGERYRKMLNEFLIPELKRRHKYRVTWFQQDGATCHSATDTISLLREHFGHRIISLNTEISWPPRSPDFSACDFFLWGYLKSKVYQDDPRTLKQLLDNIIRESRLIRREMLNKVFNNFKKRLVDCVKNDGKHLGGIIFKT
ncbi:uncharacterized protein LOC135842968 [Planococcus citri]|uniref:uncharacterized protein LOC135831659 n=1 Tax=Planococcus citri TaxID=170843 RepID=UPI0031F7E661